MVTDAEWSERFCKEVRSIMQGMVRFTLPIADQLETYLANPIENEETIRRALGTFGGSIHMSSPRGENRDQDVVGTGREVAWSCNNDDCLRDHCTICGRHESNAGDGHAPWHDGDLPACIPRPRFRRDVREEE